MCPKWIYVTKTGIDVAGGLCGWVGDRRTHQIGCQKAEASGSTDGLRHLQVNIVLEFKLRFTKNSLARESFLRLKALQLRSSFQLLLGWNVSKTRWGTRTITAFTFSESWRTNETWRNHRTLWSVQGRSIQQISTTSILMFWFGHLVLVTKCMKVLCLDVPSEKHKLWLRPHMP